MPDMVLDGKVALVTGGGSGLGKGIALGLAGRGADVVVASRRLAPNEEVAAEISAMGRRSLAVATDLQKVADIEALVVKTVAAFGRIDILVNNAGTSPVSAGILDIEEWAWDKILDTNLKGAFFCTQAVAREMASRRKGKIINITSAAGSEGSPGIAAYGASKAALIHLTRTMALELAPYGINVNAIGPATFDVGMSRYLLKSSEMAEAIVSRTPLGRLGTVEDLLGAVVLLASEASDYITGQTLFIDGGWLA
jgi:NAD(P)-dependent dehydrogenase (short-subunit alcohol dehydrogenase family)